MADTKKLKDGSVELKPAITSRCSRCGKVNPAVSAYPGGQSSDAQMIIFVVECCKTVVGAQLVVKGEMKLVDQGPPIPN